jgi:hypothetical protein
VPAARIAASIILGFLMPWIIGIDEAGYGPPLGPLVMTSVACRIPGTPARTDLWRTLQAAVRRQTAEPDERILIADSKVVYSTSRGLAGLEIGVTAALSSWQEAGLQPLAGLVERLSPAAPAELKDECWYTGTTPLPTACDTQDIVTAARRLVSCSKRKRITWGLMRSVIICPARFNSLIERWGSKGAILGEGLAELVQCNLRSLESPDPLHFVVDKHGGRNNYAALLQNALPDGLVFAREESMARSTYHVLGLGRSVEFRIQPRADAEHFCVALASMVSKYLRELLMGEFNAFWQSHVPGLMPTAGYYGDAGRFFEEIRPKAEQLGIPEPALWRSR